MDSEYRISFYHQGERLFSYPASNEAEDAQLATMELLAHQRGCAMEDIGVFLEECAPKKWDFSRDCVAERVGGHGSKERWRILNITNGTMHSHTGPLDEFVSKYEAGEV